MTSTSPSGSARSRGGSQQPAGSPAAGGAPAQPTPQSRPPAKPPDADDGVAGAGGRIGHADRIRRSLKFGADEGPALQQRQQQLREQRQLQPAPGSRAASAPPLALQLTQDGGSEAHSGDSHGGSGGSRGLFSAEAGSAAAARLKRPWRPPRMAAAAVALGAWQPASLPADPQAAAAAVRRQASTAGQKAPPRRARKLLGGMSAVPMAAAAAAEWPDGRQQQPRRIAMGGSLVSRGRQAVAAAAKQSQSKDGEAVKVELPDATAAAAAAAASGATTATAALPDDLDDIEVVLSDGSAQSASPHARQSTAPSSPDQVMELDLVLFNAASLDIRSVQDSEWAQSVGVCAQTCVICMQIFGPTV